MLINPCCQCGLEPEIFADWGKGKAYATICCWACDNKFNSVHRKDAYVEEIVPEWNAANPATPTPAEAALQTLLARLEDWVEARSSPELDRDSGNLKVEAFVDALKKVSVCADLIQMAYHAYTRRPRMLRIFDFLKFHLMRFIYRHHKPGFVDFAEQLPGQCPICSYHDFGVREGYIEGPVKDHFCIEEETQC
jgi:hypothetical protein